LALEALSPLGHGVGGTAELAGDLLVGGRVGVGAAEDDAGAEGECLRGRVGVGEAAEVEQFVGGQDDA
jgi:hypothetical protein